MKLAIAIYNHGFVNQELFTEIPCEAIIVHKSILCAKQNCSQKYQELLTKAPCEAGTKVPW